jgi:prophage regulatory protein
MNDKLLTEIEIRKIVPLAHSTIWRLVRDGQFPRPIKIGKSARFSEREIQEWIAARLAARPEAAV